MNEMLISEKKPDKKETEKQQWNNDVRELIDSSFHEGNSENLNSRINFVWQWISPFLDANLIDANKDTIRSSLERCSTEARNATDFTEQVFRIIKPIIDLRFEKPQEFEAVTRQEEIARSGFTPINQLLAYNTLEDSSNGAITIKLHILSNTTTPLSKKMYLWQKGLQDLAKIIVEEKSIKEIRGGSWIVAKNPELVKRMGFSIKGKEGSSGDAYISREDFLQKYLTHG